MNKSIAISSKYRPKAGLHLISHRRLCFDIFILILISYFFLQAGVRQLYVQIDYAPMWDVVLETKGDNRISVSWYVDRYFGGG